MFFHFLQYTGFVVYLYEMDVSKKNIHLHVVWEKMSFSNKLLCIPCMIGIDLISNKKGRKKKTRNYPEEFLQDSYEIVTLYKL